MKIECTRCYYIIYDNSNNGIVGILYRCRFYCVYHRII